MLTGYHIKQTNSVVVVTCIWPCVASGQEHRCRGIAGDASNPSEMMVMIRALHSGKNL